MRLLRSVVPGIFSVLPWATLAQGAPALDVPVDCEMGKACVVQNYVDRDPGSGARDYRCGVLTYEGHKGTDIRVIDSAARRDGVAVLAAAPGRVRAVRDGMPDVSVRETGKESVAGREAGNSIVIEHGDGWETQYAHLRNGSVSVRPGDAVESGRKLGVIGLSGQTEFTHLHFEVRYRRNTVDPFVGLAPGEPCRPGREPLWRPQALAALSYVETGALDAGVAGKAPELRAGSVDPARAERFDAGSGAAVFWVQIFGAQKDDIEELRLVAPDGTVLAERRTRISRNLAQWLTYTGKKRGPAGWSPGTYRGEYTLYRGPEERKVLSLAREIRVPPRVEP